MEFKGTKGKWEISEEINDNERVCIVSESNDNFIDCWSLQFCSEEEMRANANLIAAAPELLKALQDLYNSLDSCIDLTPREMRNAKEAINKALK